MSPYAFADYALAQRLERAESAANASFVDARSWLLPSSPATWIDVDGTWAMFDGVGSPLTQSFGFGLFSAPLGEQMDALEHFFEVHNSEVYHEVSPLAHPDTLLVLADRGYVPVELTSVLHRPLDASMIDAEPAHPSASGLSTRISTVDVDGSLWAETSAAGWGEFPELGDFMREIGGVMSHSRHTFCFLAEIDGQPAGAGALSVHQGVALLAGASTIPAFRGRGAQNALLHARLAFAASQGCDLAMMGALPGSASQRNAERQGFRIAYTRIKWGRRV